MRRPANLAAFTAAERDQVQAILGAKVAYMMGRKMEEGDWADVYCRAKDIPNRGWSNLNLDIVHNNLGLEHKMLCYRSNLNITEACGNKFMHPSATRSIRPLSTTVPEEEAMRDVLGQYAQYLENRKAKVAEQAPPDTTPDMRTGWLLWQESLRQFLYFEEETLSPNPDDYTARWETRKPSGARKGSTNLWIFEKETGTKRYSITTEAGAKVQPYFDVPAFGSPNLYVFTVIGETIDIGFVRLWITEGTARELRRLIGTLEADVLSDVIIQESTKIVAEGERKQAEQEAATTVLLTAEAYAALHSALPGVSDEHSMQLLAQHLRHDS